MQRSEVTVQGHCYRPNKCSIKFYFCGTFTFSIFFQYFFFHMIKFSANTFTFSYIKLSVSLLLLSKISTLNYQTSHVHSGNYECCHTTSYSIQMWPIKPGCEHLKLHVFMYIITTKPDFKSVKSTCRLSKWVTTQITK